MSLLNHVGSIVVLGGLFCLLQAHPAKKVVLTLTADTLEVTVFHKVKDPKTHYISQVEVSVGDSLIEHRDYSEQTSNETLVDRFILPKQLLMPNSTIYAETLCNKYGTKNAKLKIEGE